MVSESSTSQSVLGTVRQSIGDTKSVWVVLAGVGLFFIPEPITSVIGAIVIVVGAVLWALERAL